MKKNNNHDEGEGHKARIIVTLRSTFDMDGDKTCCNIDYDLTVTVEHIDYIVRQIAGGIAQAASKIARDGISSGKKAASHIQEPATESVTD